MRQILALCVILAAASTRADDNIHVTPATKLANGSITVFRKADAAPTELLVHFHGATETAKAAFIKSDLNVVLVVVNFPGLSSAYSKPFAAEPDLFEQILKHASTVAATSSDQSPVKWQRVSVSSFSAGFGAVREILKTPKNFDRIDAIVAADSIYAGLKQDTPDRQVDDQNMRDFQRFAALAADSKKAFVISHSAQPTTYASTTETADYLLRSLSLTRDSNSSIKTDSMQQTSQASQGRFVVLGFSGESGKDHMQHLHNIHLLWKRLAK